MLSSAAVHLTHGCRVSWSKFSAAKRRYHYPDEKKIAPVYCWLMKPAFSVSKI